MWIMRNKAEDYYSALETICSYSMRSDYSELREYLSKNYNANDIDDFIYALTIALNRVVRLKYKKYQ